MNPAFNKVVIKPSDSPREGAHNIWLAVHPLKLDYIRGSDRPGDYGRIGNWSDTPQYLKDLIDQLWDTLPGLHHLSFSNGQVVIQHSGAFSDQEITEVAIEIIRPVLEANLSLESL